MNYRRMRDIHKTTFRLYLAARELRQTSGPANVAKFLNISQQVIKNWEERGMSCEGILRSAEALGCRPLWLAHGTGEMVDVGAERNRGAKAAAAPRRRVATRRAAAGAPKGGVAARKLRVTGQWINGAIAYLVEARAFDLTVHLDKGRYRIRIRPETSHED